MSKANTSQNICDHGSLIIMCDRCEKNKRIAELESDLATARKDGVMWQESHAQQGQRIVELEDAVKVLATEVYGKALDRSVGDQWAEEIGGAVWANPIAAAAVREASNES